VGVECFVIGKRQISWQKQKRKRNTARAYLGLNFTILLAVGELGAYGAVQPWQRSCRARRWCVGQYRWIGFVFGCSCRGGALLAFFERAKPGFQVCPVGEEPASVDEAQATALELWARFSDLRDVAPRI
jgi:hypothetical protein